MLVTVARLRTETGDDLLAVVPSPSWPRELKPHAFTVPSASRASEW
jgi:hypothetical protein